MDAECAFCGRADSATRQIFCHDCQTPHRVCSPCAYETLSEAATLGLEPYLQAA